MARLIVSAVTREAEKGGAEVGVEGTALSVSAQYLSVLVSVSRADDGSAVTGLKKHNFQVCVADLGGIAEFKLVAAEHNWESGGADQEKSGCYALSVVWEAPIGEESRKWEEGEVYALGIQAQVYESSGNANLPLITVVDRGQTVVSVKSTGH